MNEASEKGIRDLSIEFNGRMLAYTQDGGYIAKL